MEISCTSAATEKGLAVFNVGSIGEQSYVPWSEPFFSKLFGKASSLIAEARYDLIVGWYLEPYGLVASLAGFAHDIPCCLVHAGSDLFRLSQDADLRASFSVAFGLSTAVLTEDHPTISREIYSISPNIKKLHYYKTPSLPKPYRLEVTSSLTVDEVHVLEWYQTFLSDNKLADKLMNMFKIPEPDGGALRFGFCGKVNPFKRLHGIADAFRGIIETSGHIEIMLMPVASERDYRMIVGLFEGAGIMDNVVLWPPFHPRAVPQFLNCCDVVFSLESEFPIKLHAPQLPREALAAGCVLVISKELVSKTGLSGFMSNGKNCVIVEDPSVSSEIRVAIEYIMDQSNFKRIRFYSRKVSEFIEDNLEEKSIIRQYVDGDTENVVGALIS